MPATELEEIVDCHDRGHRCPAGARVAGEVREVRTIDKQSEWHSDLLAKWHAQQRQERREYHDANVVG
jgi:hypothetical protein